ncbi:MAG TPA: hypothetical protein PKV71_00835 [Calditrichia bacterium]|nr:hypothetical protein [Calditrichota bacterium]HQU72211.1 hypothetical protein [Calditrichia bacterium]HQV30383.1 hypothetical protein [Calditrichia bacterium]
MLVNHVHQALAQVRELQNKILEGQRFKGYSGRARAICGTAALLAAVVFSTDQYPDTATSHALGWGLVALFGVLLNFGALIHWFLFDPKVKRDIRRLKPTLDALPSILVGGVLTYIMLNDGHHQYLFGIWMSLFGLANLASWHVLPRRIWMVGLYYIVCGAICLLVPNVSFTNPWPMGLVFFVGEWAGGMVLHFDEAERLTVSDLMRIFTSKEDNHAQHI